MSSLVQRIQDWSDVWNPVLVRETRRALRGKFFLISFALTLSFATVFSVGMMLLTEEEYPIGQGLFQVCTWFLALAICYLVPLGAFFSLGAEHEDKTRDLLILSNLTPGKIIRGKFFSAMSLSMLFTVALLPFMALTALLRGVDLFEIGAQVSVLLLRGTLSTLIAICFSSLAPSRGLRVFLMIVMLFLFTRGGTLMIPLRMMAGGISASPWARPSEIPFAAIVVLIVGSFAYTLACGRFAHPEENRSTPLRIQVSLTVAFIVGLFVLFPNLGAGSFRLLGASTPTVPHGVFVSSLALLSFAALVFASEPSRLGRRARTKVPSGLLGLLAFPYLPGGGRAIAWYLLNAGALIFVALFLQGLSGATTQDSQVLKAGFVSVFSTLAFFLWFSALIPGFREKLGGRTVLVLMPIAAVCVTSFLFEITFSLGGSRGTLPAYGFVSPIGLLIRIGDGTTNNTQPAMLITMFLGLLGFLLNVPRLFKEARELMQLRKDRRAVGNA